MHASDALRRLTRLVGSECALDGVKHVMDQKDNSMGRIFELLFALVLVHNYFEQEVPRFAQSDRII